MSEQFTKQEMREVVIFLDRIFVWERHAMSMPGMLESAAVGIICDLARYLSPEIQDCIFRPLEEDEHE